MASHILDLLLEERPKDAYTIVNLGKIHTCPNLAYFVLTLQS